jgi:hypothetical protein
MVLTALACAAATHSSDSAQAVNTTTLTLCRWRQQVGRAHGVTQLGKSQQAGRSQPLPAPPCTAAYYDCLTRCLVSMDNGTLISRDPATGAIIASSYMSSGNACTCTCTAPHHDAAAASAAAALPFINPDILHGAGRGYVATGHPDGSVKVGDAGMMTVVAGQVHRLLQRFQSCQHLEPSASGACEQRDLPSVAYLCSTVVLLHTCAPL